MLYPTMVQALAGKQPTSGSEGIAEGIAVKSPGALPLQVIKALVENILLVDEPALEHAVMKLAEDARQVVEGAGAAPLAAVFNDPGPLRRPQGGADRHQQRRQLAPTEFGPDARPGARGAHPSLRVDITDRPGALAKVAGLIGASGGRIHRDPPPAPVPRRAGQARRHRRSDRDAQRRPRARDRRPPDPGRLQDPRAGHDGGGRLARSGAQLVRRRDQLQFWEIRAIPSRVARQQRVYWQRPRGHR